MSRLVALTGGSGFVGAAIIDQLLARGDNVRALLRNRSSISNSERIQIVRGALEDADALRALAEGADAFIHCAGLTHARRDEDYFGVNADGARAAAAAAAEASARFIHISSMSAREPALSAYAASKRAGETAVIEASGENPWIILRAPAIYGPGDRATLPYFKMVKAGIAAEPMTASEARASLLFVEDLAEAILAAVEEAPAGRIYEIGDMNADGLSWREIGRAMADVFDVRVRRVRVPRPLIAAYHTAARAAAAVRGTTPAVRSGQVNEFFHSDWVAHDNLLSAATGWRPRTPLKEGFAKTVRWYQDNGLL